MDVVLVAAKREMIGDYTAVAEDAGLVPIVMDVDAFCLQNCYEVNYGIDPGRGVSQHHAQRADRLGLAGQ